MLNNHKKLIFAISFIVIVIAGVLGILFWQGIISLRRFPELANPKTITLYCNYGEDKVSISTTLYQSVDKYYASDPQKDDNSLENNYLYFVNSDEKDQTIKELVSQIKTKANDLKLTADRTLDLATCFVQNIPYDSDKAKKVLSETNDFSEEDLANIQGRFPYETLYDNEGICTDKTYLEVAFIKELGYGSSILTFNDQRHMAAGVKVPKEYSSLQTGYGYIETTNTGYKVGQLPVLDSETGGAKNNEIEKVNNNFIPEIPESELTAPSSIITVSDGKNYDRIIEIAKIDARIKEIIPTLNIKNNKLQDLKNDVATAKTELDSAKNDFQTAENEMKAAESAYQADPTTQTYGSYLSKYELYLVAYNSYQDSINRYNVKADFYNQQIAAFNTLIDEYNRLIKAN